MRVEGSSPAPKDPSTMPRMVPLPSKPRGGYGGCVNLADRILFVDAEAIVLDKPAGLPVDTPRRGGDSIASRLDELKGGFKRPPTPMHRLDTDTSGCLLFARTPKARALFQKAFETRSVEKYYLAVVATEIAEHFAARKVGRNGDIHLLWPRQGEAVHDCDELVDRLAAAEAWIALPFLTDAADAPLLIIVAGVDQRVVRQGEDLVVH